MLRNVVDCPADTLFVARLDGHVIGTSTLVVFPIPTGVRAWIEDVVVGAEATGSRPVLRWTGRPNSVPGPSI